MRAYKIESVAEFFVIPINNTATALQLKYPFLTKQTWTQYFNLNLPDYPQIIFNVKFNHITQGLSYNIGTIEGDKLTSDLILQEGFLLEFSLYNELAPFQIYYINNTLFLVSVSIVVGAYFKELEALHTQNIQKLYNEKI